MGVSVLCTQKDLDQSDDSFHQPKLDMSGGDWVVSQLRGELRWKEILWKRCGNQKDKSELAKDMPKLPLQASAQLIWSAQNTVEKQWKLPLEGINRNLNRFPGKKYKGCQATFS